MTNYYKLALSALFVGVLSIPSFGQTMTLKTSAEAGTVVRILPNTTSATTPISIDWGNGIEQKYTVDPSQAAYNRWIVKFNREMRRILIEKCAGS